MLLNPSNARSASVNYPQIGLNVTAQLTDDGSMLTVSSTRTSCPVQFARIKPAEGWNPTDTTTPAGSSNFTVAPTIPSVNQIMLVNSPKAGSHAYVAALGVSTSTPIQKVYIHYSSSSDSQTASQPMTLQTGSAIAFTGAQAIPRLVYTSDSIIISDSETLTYAFSFDYLDQTSYTNFYSFAYSKSGYAQQDIPAAGSVSDSLLLGQYQTTNDCQTNPSCCCGTGVIAITADSSTSVSIQSALSGSACFGQTSLGGAFTVNSSNSRQVSNTFSMQGLSATFTAALPATDNNTLLITNSFQPMCTTRAVRVGGVGTMISPVQKPFIGSYLFDNTCITGSACCCAKGVLNVAAPLGNQDLNSSALVFAGSLDGSNACASQTVLSQTFNVVSPNVAEFTLSTLTLTGAISADGNKLQFVNNMYPLCISTASRTSSQPAAGSSSASSATLPIVGSYESDGSCKPSPQCCCTGTTSIALTSNSQLDVQSTLIGQDLSCLGRDGPVDFTFTPTNLTSASTTFQGVTFVATTGDDGSVLIENNLHPMCPSRLIKVSNDPTVKSKPVKNAAHPTQPHTTHTVVFACIFALFVLA